MWKAYYRRQPARLFGAARPGAARAGPRRRGRAPLAASLLLTRAAAGFAASTGDYERFAPDIGRAYRMLGLPEHVDVEAVARHELRWWVVRREIGLAAGAAAGDAITDLYAALYDVPRERVAEAGAAARSGRRDPRPRARPTIRTDRAVTARPTGRRSRACCASRIGASASPCEPVPEAPVRAAAESSWTLAVVRAPARRPTRRPGTARPPATQLERVPEMNGVRPWAIVSLGRSVR